MRRNIRPRFRTIYVTLPLISCLVLATVLGLKSVADAFMKPFAVTIAPADLG